MASASYRGNVNDTADATFNHATKDLARQEGTTDQVKIEIGLPVGDFDRLERMIVSYGYLRIITTGCVNKYGGAANLLDDVSWQTSRLVLFEASQRT